MSKLIEVEPIKNAIFLIWSKADNGWRWRWTIYFTPVP